MVWYSEECSTAETSVKTLLNSTDFTIFLTKQVQRIWQKIKTFPFSWWNIYRCLITFPLDSVWIFVRRKLMLVTLGAQRVKRYARTTMLMHTVKCRVLNIIFKTVQCSDSCSSLVSQQCFKTSDGDLKKIWAIEMQSHQKTSLRVINHN